MLDDEREETVDNYLPLVVEPAEFATAFSTLGRESWPLPEPGKIVLVVLDGDQKTVDAKLFGSDAMAPADAFLKQHKPAARDEAHETGRRVWVVYGGPRCGPCLLLGRWMADHHATLEKDFVIVKVMGGLDAHSDEVIAMLPIVDGDGIPWFAITEPDGTILSTSHGPLGNIGFPNSFEGLRHFRHMLDRTVQKLTADEVEGLVESLSGE
jgi:hypothetical protein